MSERNLLELAAKAIGITGLDFYYPEREGHGMYFGPRLPMCEGVLMAAVYSYWNPLKDDGDAFRLAYKLGMDVDMCACWVQYEGRYEIETMECEGGSLSNVREAIVRTAAEIGKLI